MTIFRKRQQIETFGQIVSGCVRGDVRSQELLYRKYFSYVLGIAQRYSSSNQVAAEVTNDTFLKVFRSINTYNPANEFKAWIRRITINTALDYNRKEKKHSSNLPIAEATNEEFEGNIDADLDAKAIISLLQQLPPLLRATFNLYEIEGYKHEEIAQMFGIEASTSRSNLTRAKKQIRVLIQNLNHNESRR